MGADPLALSPRKMGQPAALKEQIHREKWMNTI